MSLFNTVNTVAPELAAANHVKASSNQLFNTLLNWFKTNYNSVWYNRVSGVTPEKIVEAMGTDACMLFTLSAGLAQFLNDAKPGCVPLGMPSGYTFVPHDNGSATITKI